MKKVVYIPGWMDRMSYHGLEPALDIWGSDIDYEKKIDAHYVVAYSLGCNFALLNWMNNQNTKLILVNPLLKRKSIFYWMLKHQQFLLFEGFNSDTRRLTLLAHPIVFFRQTFRLLTCDPVTIVEKIPPKDIIVVRGKSDRFFCDAQVARWIQTKNIKLIELDGIGHEWKNEFAQAAGTLIV